MDPITLALLENHIEEISVTLTHADSLRKRMQNASESLYEDEWSLLEDLAEDARIIRFQAHKMGDLAMKERRELKAESERVNNRHG